MFEEDEQDFFVFGRNFEDFGRNSEDIYLNISIHILKIF